MIRRRAYGDLERIEVLVEVSEQYENKLYLNCWGRRFVDFGDNTTESGTSYIIEHIYENSGIYKVIIYGRITNFNYSGNLASGVLKSIEFYNTYRLSSLTLSPYSTVTATSLDIESLDLSNCINIKSFNISRSKLTYVDLSNLSKLKYLTIAGNPNLDSIDLGNSTNLTSVSISNNSKLTSIDLSKALTCETITVNANALENLTLPKTETVTSLNCANNKLTALDVSDYINLSTLICSNNQITELDVSNNVVLTQLNCSINLLSELDVSNNTELKILYCNDNPFVSETENVSLDLTNNLLLENLQCQKCNLTEIINIENLVNLKKLYIAYFDNQRPNQVNRIQSLDLRLLGNLTELYIGIQSLSELWLPNPDENNHSNIKTIQSVNKNATAIPITIHNLSGVKMECDLTLYNHILQGDYDLSNIDYYAIATNKTNFSIVSIQATGNLKVKDYINRDWIYNKNAVNGAPPCFIFKANTFEIVCEDGSIITDKAEYYRHLAEVVTAEELYDYPQHNKITSPVYALNETREMYDSHKVLLCDSGDQNSWQNRYVLTGISTVSNRSNIVWVQSFSVLVDNNTINTFKLVIKEGADFYITNAYNGYSSYDTRQRFVMENGELVGKNGAIVNSKTVLENGDIEYNISANFVTSSLANNYAKYAFLYENIYPSESDPYISKIVSFEKIE